MTIHVLGSVNVDHVHRVPHFPLPGETLADTGYVVGLGGKGANQAIAAARAGASVRLAGGIGADGTWARDRIEAEGVATAGLATLEAATGHAVIYVTERGENSIVIHGGANRAFGMEVVEAALAAAEPGDWWLTQNETALVVESMAAAKAAGLRTAHAAAPFDPAATEALVDQCDLLAVNEGEAAALAQHMGRAVEALPIERVLVTLGDRGARLYRAGEALGAPAFAVLPLDTTGAGDCFFGSFLAALDLGVGDETALRRSAAAAALSVTREGAADAIPTVAEVDAFLAERA